MCPNFDGPCMNDRSSNLGNSFAEIFHNIRELLSYNKICKFCNFKTQHCSRMSRFLFPFLSVNWRYERCVSNLMSSIFHSNLMPRIFFFQRCPKFIKSSKSKSSSRCQTCLNKSIVFFCYRRLIAYKSTYFLWSKC